MIETFILLIQVSRSFYVSFRSREESRGGEEGVDIGMGKAINFSFCLPLLKAFACRLFVLI